MHCTHQLMSADAYHLLPLAVMALLPVAFIAVRGASTMLRARAESLASTLTSVQDGSRTLPTLAR